MVAIFKSYMADVPIKIHWGTQFSLIDHVKKYIHTKFGPSITGRTILFINN